MSTKLSKSYGWRKAKTNNSLEEINKSIEIPHKASFFKKLLAFSGPGYMVAVGYMDPGNWATGLAGGSKFGYTLLSVIFISNLMAILLQHLALKLGIVTGRDLAQACRDHYSKPIVIFLWVLAEIAIIACDLAEVIGSAIALNLLFNIPLIFGVIITSVDVLLLLTLQHKKFRYLEIIVMVLIAIIMVCFAIDFVLAKPNMMEILKAFIPPAELLRNPEMLYIAIGILGATVMPHNLYLHSSIAQTRHYEETVKSKKEAIKFSTIDSTIALSLAFFVNAAILIVAAAVFYSRGIYTVTEIQEAYYLFAPLLGTSVASIVFALALLASGQNATVTGTLAGQIIMEGFINIKVIPWLRRLISRGITIVPAALAVIFFGQHGLAQLLLLSQIILSLQLPFAIVPLVKFTSQRSKMGVFANSKILIAIAYTIAAIIILLNFWLIYTTCVGY